jgi:hypothetical protein
MVNYYLDIVTLTVVECCVSGKARKFLDQTGEKEENNEITYFELQ